MLGFTWLCAALQNVVCIVSRCRRNPATMRHRKEQQYKQRFFIIYKSLFVFAVFLLVWLSLALIFFAVVVCIVSIVVLHQCYINQTLTPIERQRETTFCNAAHNKVKQSIAKDCLMPPRCLPLLCFILCYSP
jgi:heme exporter protein D